MLNLTSLQDVQRLIYGKIEESVTLEYKSGLDNKEVARSVCALANSQGGTIVYGVKEKDKIPVTITGVEGIGVEERIQNIIRTSIQPRLNAVGIKRIENYNDGSRPVYVVNVSPSPHAPHMTNYRYYRRRGSESVPMENDEVVRAMLGTGRIEALHSEIRCNRTLAEETLSMCEQIFRVPVPERKTVAFVPFHTDAWNAVASAGLTVAVKEEALRKLQEAYRLIHEANSLFEYSKVNIELVVHTPAERSSWTHGTYLPSVIQQKLGPLLGLLRELENLL
jgi:hypothetical protein